MTIRVLFSSVASLFDTRPPNMAIFVLPSNVGRLDEQDGTSGQALIYADSPHSSD